MHRGRRDGDENDAKRPILLSLILASVALVCELIPAISAGALVESVHSTSWM
jgi:hypothetical protein